MKKKKDMRGTEKFSGQQTDLKEFYMYGQIFNFLQQLCIAFI